MKNILKKNRREIIVLCLLMVAAIAIRSIQFAPALNFMQDQADDSTTAINSFRSGKPVLIGPPTAYTYIGRRLLQGPLIVYTYGLFQALGNFDPHAASYIFMITAILMSIPLYIGIRLLFNKNTALATTALYLFVPYYMNYTRFMWNPNSQFIFVPFLFISMGLYKRSGRALWLAAMGFMCGVLLQYHFQFVPVMAFVMGWTVYRMKRGRMPGKTIAFKAFHFIAGFALGWSPYILFELRHQFYNTQTVILFLTHIKEVTSRVNASSAPVLAYYGLSTSLIILPFTVHWILSHKMAVKPLWIFIGGCAAISLYLAAQPTTRPFLGREHWYYADEAKVHRIIREQHLNNFAVAMLHYDNLSSVQKYLMTRDKTPGVLYNYRTNRYLFAVSDDDNFKKYGAYEIREFVPRKLVKKWEINKHYQLYLFQRTR